MRGFHPFLAVAVACCLQTFVFAVLATAETVVSIQATGESSDPEESTIVRELHADRACAEFHETMPIGSGWKISDCVSVWASWADTLPDAQFQGYPDRELFNETALALRQRGPPCLMKSVRYPDGVGSSTVRHLATWMFAKEMGCEWQMPDLPPGGVDDTGTILYCHKTVTLPELHRAKKMGDTDYHLQPCALTNWMEYFRFMDHAVADETGDSNVVSVKLSAYGSQHLEQALDFHRTQESDSRPWEHWKFRLGKIDANRYMEMVPSWDAFKRETVRGVLNQFRESFHEFPRPWYDHEPHCIYNDHELNFAIHVRLGDRAELLTDTESLHLEYLGRFMNHVTESMVLRGLDPPAFHIFSETADSCPSEVDGTFAEFPKWPVEMDQIPACLDPNIPTDCPEKLAGAPICNSERSGIFRVSGKPLYLHVGLDVQNEMSCMIQADGVLMGCSTFGQVSGILNRGMKFFSIACEGDRTPIHYKLMPPLAIAEQGKLWVPISGSWHNPVIFSSDIFAAALDEYLNSKDLGVGF